MDLGLHYAIFSHPDGEASIATRLAETARIADEGGISIISLMDHWFQMEAISSANEPMLEGYTGLGFLAGQTHSIRLGLLVTGVTYRHPGLLAKIVTTLDVLSGGRAQLGLGSAWYEREHLGLGVSFPPLSERFERLEEALQICLQMWSDNDGPYRGRHYQLAETICSPRPVQQPRPPILIGGGGEKKTLKLVAQYADSCNLFSSSIEEVARKIDVLNRHCEDVGRDPSQIAKTILGMSDPLSDPDEFLRQMEQYAKLGVSLVEVVPFTDPVNTAAELCQRIVPRLSAIG